MSNRQENNNELSNKRIKAFKAVIIPMFNKLSAKDIQANWMRGDSLDKAKLSQAIGWGCQTQTFRQNRGLSDLFDALIVDLNNNQKLLSKGDEQPDITTQQIGKENEEVLRLFIGNKLKAKTPWPIDHNGTLYRKAIFAEMSGQQISEVTRTPSWFSSRRSCKTILDEIDVMLIRCELPTIDMAAYSAMDQVTDDMKNPLVRKLRSELKKLQQILVAEREEKLDWKRKYDQLLYREKYLMSGSKIPRLVKKGL